MTKPANLAAADAASDLINHANSSAAYWKKTLANGVPAQGGNAAVNAEDLKTALGAPVLAQLEAAVTALA